MMIIINFKTYPQATGEKAMRLAKICEEAASSTGVKIIIAVQNTDLYRISSQVKIPVFGQHSDPVMPGKHTGWTTALALKQAGALGVMFNHSEHPFNTFENLHHAITMAKNEGLKTLVFVKDLEAAAKVDKFSPHFIALEEPSLVSSETAMVDLPKFHYLIRKFVKNVKAIPLIGAGIKNREDIFHNLKLGIQGVVLSSHFIKSLDQKTFLLACLTAFPSPKKLFDF